MEDNLNKIRTQEPTLRVEEKQEHLEELCQELQATRKKQREKGEGGKRKRSKNQKKKDERGKEAY